MSEAIKLTLSDELAARLDAARGLHSRQEWIVNAMIAALEGSCIERELRAEIERLHQTLRPHDMHAPVPRIKIDRLDW